MKPKVSPTDSLKRVSRIHAGRRNSDRAKQIPWAEGTKQREFGEVKVARVRKTKYQRKESYTEREQALGIHTLFKYFS